MTNMNADTRQLIDNVGQVIDDKVKNWLDTQLGLARASMDTEGKRKAVDQCRHVQLDGYSVNLTPRIVRALAQEGLLMPTLDGLVIALREQALADVKELVEYRYGKFEPDENPHDPACGSKDCHPCALQFFLSTIHSVDWEGKAAFLLGALRKAGRGL